MAIVNNFGNGVLGTAYEPNTYAELGNMIGKVALQIIREIEAKNPLSVLSKGEITNGDTVEQAVTKLVEASGYDQTGAGALTRDQREKLAVRYFKNWQRHTYKTTVDYAKIRKVMQTGMGAEDIAQKLVAELGQSAINDRFQSLKALLTYGSTVDSGSTIFVDKSTTASGDTTIKTLLKDIKNTIKQMTFVNSTCNSGNIERATKVEDIIIVMPYTLKNAIDVDELSGVFNLSKEEISQKIIETDDIANRCVYIVDRNAILDYRRLYEMADQKNADGLFWNFFLHEENLFALSQLFDGCFIKYTNAIA